MHNKDAPAGPKPAPPPNPPPANTKVEEALAVIASGVADRGVRIAWPGESIAELDNAGKTLARYIAQLTTQLAERDATIARLERGLATIRDSTFRNAVTLRGMADYTLNQEKSP